MATTNGQALTAKQSGIRVHAYIDTQYIFTGTVMCIVQGFFTNGNKFALIAGRTATFGKPVDRCVPEYILLPVKDMLYIRFYIIILLYRYALLKFFNSIDGIKAIFFTKISKLCRADKIIKYLFLGINRIKHKIIHCVEAHFHNLLDGWT
ncbi:hypothetical protein D9M68_780860 [compost metagenome]